MIKRLLTTDILLPSLGLLGVILFGVVLITLLKLKDKKEANGEIDYSKIPKWFIVVVTSISVIVFVVFVFLKSTLTLGSLVGGVILAIYIIYRLEKSNKDKESDE
ncbi:MAG: hypothetical protein HFJ19_03495 [Clostridia bacterium]|nr:hypothetical protein [Clostridia bacterium]